MSSGRSGFLFLKCCALVLSFVLGAVARADEFDSLYAKAYELGIAGKTAEAGAQARRLIELAQTTNPGRTDRLAQAYSFSAWLHIQAGRLDLAEPEFLRASDLYRKHFDSLGKEVIDAYPWVITLTSLSNLHGQLGAFDRADAFAREALEAAKRSHVIIGLFQQLLTRVRLAEMRIGEGRVIEAEQQFRATLDWVKSLQVTPLITADLYMGLSTALFCQDRYAEAEQALTQALAIYRAAEKDDRASFDRVVGSQVEAMKSLSMQLASLGRYADAEDFGYRALEYAQRLRTNRESALVSIHELLSNLCTHQGRLDEAQQNLRKALDQQEQLVGRNHSGLIPLLVNSAAINGALGRENEARALISRATGLAASAEGVSTLDNVRLPSLASYYDSVREWRKAEQVRTRLIDDLEARSGKQNLVVLIQRLNRIAALVRQQRYTDAEAEIQVLDQRIGSRKLRPDFLSGLHFFRAHVLWNTDRQKKAIEAIETAMAEADRYRRDSSGNEMDRAVTFSTLSNLYDDGLLFHSTLGNVSGAFRAAELKKARSMFDLANLRQTSIYKGMASEVSARLQQEEVSLGRKLASATRQLETLPPDAPDFERRRSVLEAELTTLQEALVRHQREVRNASPAYRRMLWNEFRPVELMDLQKRLEDAGTILLEYVVTDTGTYLFVAGRSTPPQLLKLQLDASQAKATGLQPGPLTGVALDKLLTVDREPLIRQLQHAGRSEPVTERLALLWEVLVPEDLRRELQGDSYRRVLIVQDGPLSYLPFEVLVCQTGPEPRYVLDEVPPISYAPSATWVAVTDPSSRGRAAERLRSVLTLGDAIYSAERQSSSQPEPARKATMAARMGASAGRLARLPHTSTESIWVEQVFKKEGMRVQKLIRNEATEDRFRQVSKGRQIIHLACHGIVDQALGNQFGAVVLGSGPKSLVDPTDDGFLTLGEIYNFDLSGCELAILSACETNFGPQQRGEGVWALSRGFLVAGVRRVVASNWLVDDEAAASLISYFCAGVAQDEKKSGKPDYARALHDARKWVRQQEKWRSPYYWGTFVLIGPP